MKWGPAVKRSAAWFVAGAVSVMSLLAVPVGAKPPPPLPDAPGQGGLSGSNGRVESVTVPARISRVAVVPGANGANTEGNDVWAIGHAISYRQGWASTDTGQLVFLRNQNKQGWVVVGPPTTPSGQVVNPILNAFAMTASGEGWAVGEHGTIVHKSPGSNTWEVSSVCDIACVHLVAIALSPNGGTGYAVGFEGTVLRLKDGAWELDARIPGQASSTGGGAAGAPTPPELRGVALAPNGDAWTIASRASDPNANGIELFRRNNAANPPTWERKTTGWDALDNAAPVQTGSTVRLGVHGASAGADGQNTIWFGGSFFPIDPANPNGDPNAGGTSTRPFVLRFKGDSVVDKSDFVPYCTAATEVGGQAAAASICGAGSGELPFAPYPINSFSGLQDGQVFAGGPALYHYRPTDGLGRWFTEPNPLGSLSSVSFANDHEGWFASTGNASFAAVPVSDSLAVGHYTSTPKPGVRVARWAYPSSAVPYGVTVSPAGEAIAVGDNGAVLKKTDLGWDQTGTTAAVRADGKDFAGNRMTHFAVDFVGNSGVAWAVGEAGYAIAIENGVPKNPERPLGTRTAGRPPNQPARDHLYGVAFNNNNNIGYAVGEFGAIVRYDATGKAPADCWANNGNCWSADPQSGLPALTEFRLYDVAAVGRGFVAVGEKGVLLLNPNGAPGNWTKVGAVSALVKSSPLFTVDTLSDGTIVAGGGRSTLITGKINPASAVVDITTPFAFVSNPPEGSVLEVAARRDGTALKLMVSLAPKDSVKFISGAAATTKGWLVDYDGTRWRDLQESSYRLKLLSTYDDVLSRDPVYSIAFEPNTGGRKGWAVGGRWGSPGTGQPGQGDKDTSYETPTRSMYRVDLVDSPVSESDLGDAVKNETPPGGFSFAFFSDTACGADLCSLSAGTGTAADETALRIRADINAAHRDDPVNGPQFVLFGGSARGTGTPDELSQFATYLAGFEIPVFGVPGARDLTPPPSTTPVQPPGVPLTINLDVLPEPPDQTSAVAGTVAYQKAFGKMPFPWGDGPVEKGFLAGQKPPPSCPGGCARTHYFFDYAPKGETLARFVFLDTSTRSLSKNAQNPSTSDQRAFLANLLPATSRGSLTSFIVMNQPTRDPSTFANDPIMPIEDITTIENAALAAGTTAVFTGGPPVNAMYTSPEGVSGAVPFYVAGTGGAPLAGTQLTSDARYHSWLLATVDPTTVSEERPQAGLTVRAIPIIESVSFKKEPAMIGQQSVTVKGGNAVVLKAFGRGIDGGGRAKDTKAMNRMYLDIPINLRCPNGGDNGAAGGGCFTRRGIRPDYRFVSENPEIADFVYSAGGSVPIRTNGLLTKDPSSGLLCTFRTGNVWVRVESGGRVSRLPITVTPGIGPCVVDAVTELVEFPPVGGEPDEPREIRSAPNNPPPPPAPKPAKVAAPPPPPKPVVPVPPQPDPVPVAKPVPKVFLAPSPLAEIVPALMPPAPSLLPSPAPPASATAAGAQKQEDKEVQHESASEDGADFTAISHRRDYAFDPAMGWMLMSVAALLGVFGAGIAATKKGGAGRPAHARVTYPRELQ